MKDGKQKDLTSVFIVVLSVMMVLTLFNSYMTYNLYTGAAKTGGTQVAPTPTTVVQQGGQQPSPPTNVKVDVAADDPVQGQANAKVTIIEFSDFQCPFCERFYSQTLGQIETNYIKTGKAKLVFKQFPLSFHPFAQKAAEASECAREQGKFWEIHNKIFDNQANIAVTDLKKYASDLGLDTTKFNDCLDSSKYAAGVAADVQIGQNAGVSGTPSFVINGQLLVGAQPYAQFQQAIDAALAK
jgi:protein-disulfide isomerase